MKQTAYCLSLNLSTVEAAGKTHIIINTPDMLQIMNVAYTHS